MQLINLTESQFKHSPNIPFKLVGGSYVCGGFVRDKFLGHKPSDIDVFFREESIIKGFIDQNKPFFEKVAFSTPTADTYIVDGTRVQLIKIFGSIEEIFDKFDFHICQFAMDNEKFYSTAEALVSSMRGHLSVNNVQAGFEVDSLRRAFKYAKKGFEPCFGTVAELARAIQSVESQESIDNQIEISPNGGSRSIKWD